MISCGFVVVHLCLFPPSVWPLLPSIHVYILSLLFTTQYEVQECLSLSVSVSDMNINALTLLCVQIKRQKVKQSRYTPCRRLGGEEV
jgi:hypothetical protein